MFDEVIAVRIEQLVGLMCASNGLRWLLKWKRNRGDGNPGLERVFGGVIALRIEQVVDLISASNGLWVVVEMGSSRVRAGRRK